MDWYTTILPWCLIIPDEAWVAALGHRQSFLTVVMRGRMHQPVTQMIHLMGCHMTGRVQHRCRDQGSRDQYRFPGLDYESKDRHMARPLWCSQWYR